MFLKKKSNKAFTLIELLVVIAIIALLVSILMPSLNKAKDLAKAAVCMSNLRGIGTCINLYATDYEGYAPPAGIGYWGYPFWDQYLVSWAGATPGQFKCPVKTFEYPDSYLDKWTNEAAWMAANFGEGTQISKEKSYSANSVFITSEKNSNGSYRDRPVISSVDRLDQKMMAQCYGSWPAVQGSNDFWVKLAAGNVEFIHGDADKMNFLMADSHVQVLTEAEVDEMDKQLFDL